MSASPLTYSVTAHTIRPGTAEIHAGSLTVPIDATWAAEPSGLPGPAELLASSFSACLLKNLERASQLLDFHYESAEVDVAARRQDSPPKFVEVSYEMRVTTTEPQRRIDLIHLNLRKFGTIYNTLAAVCDVHGTLVSVSPLPVH